MYNSSIDIFSFGVLSIFTLSQTFPCDLLSPKYQKDSKLITRTELERRDEYMQIIYCQFPKTHPLILMIERCLNFPEKRPSIHAIRDMLKKEEKDKSVSMNPLELYRALEAPQTKKERDAKTAEQRLALEEKVNVLEAERERKDEELQLMKEQVKALTTENVSLSEKLRQFQSKSNKAAKQTEELKKVAAERDELKFLLEATQAQAKMYEEDFKTEREDRARAFSEREKEGERYREGIEHLQIQLNISTETQKELMKAMDDLVQAKTSEVETYKKQQDELLAKVSTLESEIKECAKKQGGARQERVMTRGKSKSSQEEGKDADHVHGDLEKHYKAKSKARKAELIRIVAAHGKARQELLEVKKEKEKTGTKVSGDSPVASSELNELCRYLKNENEELKDQISAVMNTNQHLHRCISALAENDNGGSSEQELPHDETLGSVTSEMSTMRLASPKQTQTTSPAQPTGKHYTIPGATASTVKTNIQHADYVNQSRIQEMINQRQISPTDRCLIHNQVNQQ
ncbi:hypothetical protein GBAR_LOCUS11652 [Geodia barretti]|uniref:Protein kinase domain-containing protein n=1 Tax=Geodia barretti TaxID=519541 RepID=A0AA35RX67_GEOBA|nr:hypothetical protein GBAR_LOCUS11652 [Geodia barretti]